MQICKLAWRVIYMLKFYTKILLDEGMKVYPSNIGKIWQKLILMMHSG